MDDRLQAKKRSEDKLREAHAWREARAKALRQTRKWGYIRQAGQRVLERGRERNDTGEIVRGQKIVDAAHDMAIAHGQNADMAEKHVRSASLESAVYYQEYEGRDYKHEEG